MLDKVAIYNANGAPIFFQFRDILLDKNTKIVHKNLVDSYQ